MGGTKMNNEDITTCPICGCSTIIWFGIGGRKYIGCSKITCRFVKEINDTKYIYEEQQIR
jgi:ssDNA-binding Zn-finger/Zn-ribbon topoisomerase 1